MYTDCLYQARVSSRALCISMAWLKRHLWPINIDRKGSFQSLVCSSISYLFGSFGAALGAVPGAVSGSWASLWCLGVDIFGHVDIILQQHLLLHRSCRATRESWGDLSGTRLRELLQASPAAAPAVSLLASARLGAATAAVGEQEG